MTAHGIESQKIRPASCLYYVGPHGIDPHIFHAYTSYTITPRIGTAEREVELSCSLGLH